MRAALYFSAGICYDKGNSDSIGKSGQREILSQIKVSEIGGILYGFPNFGTAELGQKIRCSAEDD